jgi:hypothetical protein
MTWLNLMDNASDDFVRAGILGFLSKDKESFEMAKRVSDKVKAGTEFWTALKEELEDEVS